MADAVPGTVTDDQMVAAGGYWAKVIPKGSVLRVVDLAGKQAVDFICYNPRDPSERYNAADTMKYAGTIFLTEGHGIYSDMAGSYSPSSRIPVAVTTQSVGVVAPKATNSGTKRRASPTAAITS